MHRILTYIIAIILLGSCTDNEQFRVNGTIEGKPSMNLRIAYISDGAYRLAVTAAREGEFEFFASSRQPTLVEITDYEYRPLARLYAANGETFEIKVDRAKPYEATVKGNEITERLSSAYRNNAAAFSAGGDEANDAVAAYVSANPNDIVSTLLLLTVYDASRNALAADSLLAKISPDARPGALVESFNVLLQRQVSDEALGAIKPIRYAARHDSIKTFDPADKPISLIVLDRAGDYRRDSVAPALDKLTQGKKSKRKIQVLELDQEPYGSTVTGAPDTLHWAVGRIPGGLAGIGIEHLGISEEPFFIVCDSVGAQIYRGKNIGTAVKVINTILKK